MKLKSSLILIVAAIFVLSCATIGPKSASQTTDSQTVTEQALVSGIQYYLEDIDNPFVSAETMAMQTPDPGIFLDYFAILSRFDEDLFSTTAPVAEQTVVSGIQYYLEDIYHYDEPYFISKASGMN